MTASPGRLITLEGIDNCGKSLQAAGLAAWLREQGRQCVLCREPGGTPLGERLRGILLDADLPRSPLASALLFAAGRCEHVRDVIRPALERGDWVVCDRFADSTLAYQGGGNGVAGTKLEALAAVAWDGLEPDLTLLLRISPEASASRRSETDYYDSGDADFLRRVADRYDALAAAQPDRFAVLDGEQPAEQVAASMRQTVASRLQPEP